MNDAPGSARDPVCGMMVMPAADDVVHDGQSYAFCSPQCRERFIARPGLYVGARRRPAPKQRGIKLMRQRRVLLTCPLAEEQSAALLISLREMMGVVEVRYGAPPLERVRSSSVRVGPSTVTAAGELEITYDLLEATMGQLERRIAEYGGQLIAGSQHRLCRDFVHYLEECELQDLQIEDAAVARHPARRRFRIGTQPRVARGDAVTSPAASAAIGSSAAAASAARPTPVPAAAFSH